MILTDPTLLFFILPKPITTFSSSAAMAAFSEFFSHFYTITIVLCTVLVLELVSLFRKLTGRPSHPPKCRITSTQYLNFIEEKCPRIVYSKRSTSELNECTVCLSEINEGEEVRRLKCQHTFHGDCLDQWLQQFLATCPLCRTKVLPDEIVAGFHRHLQNLVEFDENDEEMVLVLSAFYSPNNHPGLI